MNFIKDDAIGEQRHIYKCECEDDADTLWATINDKMYEWSKGEIKSIDI